MVQTQGAVQVKIYLFRGQLADLTGRVFGLFRAGMGSNGHQFEVSALSDRGRLRSGNEDACGHDVGAGVFVLCDGMGGAAAGEIASHLAVESFLAAFPIHHGVINNGHSSHAALGDERNTVLEDEDATPSSHFQVSYEGIPNRLQDAVLAANSAVFAKAQRNPELRGMGTTLVALMFGETAEGYGAWMAHAGDSRCYLLRGDRLRQLTLDHSLVEEQVRMGQLTLEEAERSPLRSVITRAVGSAKSVEPEITHSMVEAGDVFLLCSDGLTRELTDSEIENVLTSGSTLDAACRQLVEDANRSGGRDNITVMLVRALQASEAG